MRTTIRSALAAIMLALAANASADLSAVPSGDYASDPSHSYISFTYSHIGFSTPHIGFRSFSANLTLDNANPEKSSVAVNIDATSVDSRVEVFNGHLNGENFFDTANNPEITFNSTSITSTGEDTYDVVGDLTIKGVTKPVTLETTINKAANHPMRKVPTVGISGSAKLSRSDWGLDRAVPNVGDEITIYVTAEMPQKKAE
jgi:polyisoprenoid-binding protein YceI